MKAKCKQRNWMTFNKPQIEINVNVLKRSSFCLFLAATDFSQDTGWWVVAGWSLKLGFYYWWKFTIPSRTMAFFFFFWMIPFSCTSQNIVFFFSERETILSGICLSLGIYKNCTFKSKLAIVCNIGILQVSQKLEVFFWSKVKQSRQTVKALSKLPETVHCKMRNLKILKLLKSISIG